MKKYPDMADRFKHIPQQRYVTRALTIRLVYSTNPKDRWIRGWRGYEASHPIDLQGTPLSRVDYADLDRLPVVADICWSRSPMFRLNRRLKHVMRLQDGKLERELNRIIHNGLTIKGKIFRD